MLTCLSQQDILNQHLLKAMFRLSRNVVCLEQPVHKSVCAVDGIDQHSKHLQGEEHPDYSKACVRAHNGAVISLQRSPFFEDIMLSVGDWSCALWKEGQHEAALFTSPHAPAPYTAACWSPTRPGQYCNTARPSTDITYCAPGHMDDALTNHSAVSCLCCFEHSSG